MNKEREIEKLIAQIMRSSSRSAIKKARVEFPAISLEELEEYYSEACWTAVSKLQSNYFGEYWQLDVNIKRKVSGLISTNLMFRCMDAVKPRKSKHYSISTDSEYGNRVLETISPKEFSTERNLIHKEVAEMVISIIKETKNKKWILLVELKFKELECQEIADQMKITVANVNNTFSKYIKPYIQSKIDLSDFLYDGVTRGVSDQNGVSSIGHQVPLELNILSVASKNKMKLIFNAEDITEQELEEYFSDFFRTHYQYKVTTIASQ